MNAERLGSCLVALGVSILSAHAGVVINEVFYHAPDEVQDLQWIELYNPGTQPVDLGGWKLSRGIDYVFPAGSKIAAGGYLVIVRNSDRFKEFYGFEPQGAFSRPLSHRNLRLDLLDAKGRLIDRARCKNEAPWPTGADGYSASLERICPNADGAKPDNWAASPLSAEMKPAGTPGQANASCSPSLPPFIKAVKFTPITPQPGQPVAVEAEIQGAGLREVTLSYRVAGPGSEGDELRITMSRTAEGHFAATIPGQKAGQLIRFRVQAADEREARRWYPGPNEPRPALSCYVPEKFEPARIPLAFVINTDRQDQTTIRSHMQTRREGFASEEDQMRMMARMQLESGLDLAPAWFALAAGSPLRSNQLVQLRAAFTNQLAAQDKLVSETLASSNLRQKLSELPQIVRSYHERVSAAVNPMLSEEQQKQFSVAQSKPAPGRMDGPSPFTAEMVLKRFLNLEGMFFKLSMRSDLTETQVAEAGAIYRAAVAQRRELIPAVQALMQGQGEFEDVREKVDKINQTVDGKMKGVLNPEQNRAFVAWRGEGEGMPGQGRPKAAHHPQGKAAFVYIDAQTHQPELFDFVQVTERNSGLNVHFQKDRLFHQMSTANLLFETNDRFVLAEPLAYEVYRRAGNAAPFADYVRLTIDGRPLGYYELIEQPNKSFLQRNHLRADGNLYKILWYENGVVRQHQKKTNRHTGHDDILALVDELEKTRSNPDEQWAVIQKNFNVRQVVNYFAVNMCLSHWDGFFNNYFTYHDTGTGRWEMYPWDQDKTWGFYDGMPEGEVFYNMPLSFGMEGDRPPGWPKDRPVPRGFGMGTPWWRPGGFFSKPLLANPHFRTLFLSRTKEILETVYTPETFFPIIDSLGERLREEVTLRATLLHEDPAAAQERLKANLQSLKDHLTKRRQFLLSQDEFRETASVQPQPNR